jgi:DNA repair protein RAD50
MDGYMMQSHAIKAYLDAGKDQELQRTIQSMQAVQAKLAANQVAMTALEDKMKALKESSQKRDSMKRDVDDNVAYLQGVQQALELKEAIDRNTAASAQFGNLPALQQDVERVNDELQRIRNQQHALRGRMETHGEQATKCKTELKAPAYKDIDERFRQENIAVRTTEMANDDLNKYYTALDKALMAFHASKMAEINKVIRELWQKTYRNPDIDHIAIVSDAESATSSGRSYNYRVVMRNREEELDMRGRCSAGQKVLACLIIRLALAETFCLNCGILALDEPTTNLDAANSASLAQALTDIMNARREQTNFQLIIITHDIKFAHLIGQREHADFYWRISKDDALHSHIEQEDIYE